MLNSFFVVVVCTNRKCISVLFYVCPKKKPEMQPFRTLNESVIKTNSIPFLFVFQLPTSLKQTLNHWKIMKFKYNAKHLASLITHNFSNTLEFMFRFICSCKCVKLLFVCVCRTAAKILCHTR